MYGVFGGYTRWAVVFLIIFVLFFLLVPGVGALGGGATGMAVTSYQAGMTGVQAGKKGFGYTYMGGYENESSS